MAGWQLPRRPVAVAERRHWSGCDQVTLQGRSPSPRHGLFQGCLVFFRRWALVPASRFCRVVFLPQRARANVCARPALSRAADNHAPPTPAWRYRRVARGPTAPAGTSIGTPAREPGCRHNMMEGGGGRGGGGGKADVLGRFGAAGHDGGRASGPNAAAPFALPARGDPHFWCVRGSRGDATGHWSLGRGARTRRSGTASNVGVRGGGGVGGNEPRRVSRATPGRPLCQSLYDALPATRRRACGWLGWRPPEAARAGRPAGQRTLRGPSRR